MLGGTNNKDGFGGKTYSKEPIRRLKVRWWNNNRWVLKKQTENSWTIFVCLRTENSGDVLRNVRRKVKFTLEQAMKSQKGSRSLAPLFL